MMKISRKYGLDMKSSKILSGLEIEDVEENMLRIIDSEVGRKMGIKSARLWKKEGDKYAIIDHLRMKDGIAGKSISASHEHVKNVISKQLVFNTSKDWMEIEKGIGSGRFYIEVSLGLGAEYILAMDLQKWKPFRKLRNEQMITSREIGWNVTKALEKAKELESLRDYAKKTKIEFDGAREIKESMLPKGHPDFFGYDVFGMNKGANNSGGGDYYDFLEKNGMLRIAIADVSGKDLNSSIIMSTVHGSIDIGRYMNLEDMLESLNKYLYEHTENSMPKKFVTAFVMDLKKDGSFDYVNAGHEHPILFKDDGPVEFENSNPLLGYFPGIKYQKSAGSLRKNDILLLYTDGVTDAASNGENFGTEGLKELVMDMRKRPSEEIAKFIFSETRSYNDKDFLDDRTVVLVKREF